VLPLKRTTIRKAGIAAALAVAAVVAAGAAPPHNDDVPTMRLYDDWRVSCPATTQTGTSCALSQDVQLTGTMTALYRLTITREGGTDILAITVPYNVLLDAGIAIDFGDGDRPVLVGFDTCEGGGCIAKTAFTESLAEDFAKARAPSVLFARLNAKPVSAPFSLKGFDRALDAYRRFERLHDAAGSNHTSP
jgi:invasion protein IalB